MDVGQSTANGLYQQAAAGSFQMEEGAARQCAEIFERFAESVDEMVHEANFLQRLDGFGGFDSAKQLQDGFGRKGVGLSEALRGLRESALRMAAAYLRAGNLLDEAENMNKLAIKAAEAGTTK